MSVFDAIGLALDLTVALDWLASPWRYLFSRGYRARKHAEWDRQQPIHGAIQLIGGILGGVFGIGGVAILVYVIWIRR